MIQSLCILIHGKKWGVGMLFLKYKTELEAQRNTGSGSGSLGTPILLAKEIR